VVLHWGTAMAFIASLVAMMLFASEPSAPQPQRGGATLLGVLSGTALVAFVTMCVGAFVSSSGAGLACLSIPNCAGHVVVYSEGQYVQMLHRFIAGGTFLCAVIAFTFSWLRPASIRVRYAASAGLILVFVQVLLGLLNVALRLPTDLREAHAFNAALVFLAFVVAALFAAMDEYAAQSQTTVA
jgi:heme A synthase